MVVVRRVYTAVEQVADQVRSLIAAGEIAPGDRLPSEAALSNQFGVSRATIREALKSLAGQDLIRTSKGPTGGNFVSVPTAHHVEEFLTSTITLMTQSNALSLEELLEARAQLEVEAAALAAARRTQADLAILRGAIPSPLAVDVEAGATDKGDFHRKLLSACGNTCIAMAAQPIASVLALAIKQSAPSRRVSQGMREQHRAILRAIEEADSAAAAAAMRRHLDYLRPIYVKDWRYALQRSAAA